MIFQSHNFVSNFDGANSANDNDLLYSIMASEVADLLTSQIQNVFDLFTQSKIPFNTVTPYSVYIDKIIANIKSNNTPFINGLSYLLISSNQDFSSQWQGDLGTVSQGIQSIASNIISNPSDEKLLRSQMLNAVAVRLARQNDNTRNLDFNTNTVFVVGYLILVAGLLVYAVRKHLYPFGTAAKPMNLGAKPSSDPKTDPAFNVGRDVLIPEGQIPPPVPPAAEPVAPVNPPAPAPVGDVPPPIPVGASVEPLKTPQV